MRGFGLPGRRAAVALALAASLPVLFSCGKQENTYAPPPPPPVGVSQPLRQVVTPYIQYTGNTVAVNQVNLEDRRDVIAYLESLQPRMTSEAAVP